MIFSFLNAQWQKEQGYRKHYKLHNKFKCVDEAVSIDENKFKDMVKNIRRIEKILGNSSFGIENLKKYICLQTKK